VITEDLVFMFESMGVSTGVALGELFKARELLVRAIPDEPIYGHTPVAGLPKGFRAHA
jgi:hydroxymethylglutaryl-CoA lyase